MNFKDIVMQRYACKKFDGTKIPQEKIDQLIELIRYSASSLNLQPWKIKIIEDMNTKKKLKPHTYHQQQITTCSHVLVFCADTEFEKLAKKLGDVQKKANMPLLKRTAYMTVVKGYLSALKGEKRLHYAQLQVYIALGNAINGAKSLGFDSCPIGGFNPDKYAEILKLPKHIVPTVVLPIGYPADKPKKKIRFEKDEIIL